MVGSGSSNCIVGIIQSSNPEVILCMIVSRVFQCDVIGCEHSHPVKKKKATLKTHTIVSRFYLILPVGISTCIYE